MSRRLLYIASGLGSADRVGRLRDIFRDYLVGLTFDWTTAGEVRGPAASAEFARLQAEGVRQAKCLLLLMPGGRGTHFELGMAHALGIPTVALNDVEAPWDVTFHHLCELLKCKREEDAIHTVLEILREKASTPGHSAKDIR